MPFLGQDWRSPGWRWIKTEDGWKPYGPCRSEHEDENTCLNSNIHSVLYMENMMRETHHESNDGIVINGKDINNVSYEVLLADILAAVQRCSKISENPMIRSLAVAQSFTVCLPRRMRDFFFCEWEPRKSILDNDDKLYSTDCESASKKRKKDHFRNNVNSQWFCREKWIYVHKESTKERHGYCTLGEAFNRLDFSSAIQDIRRFNYVVKLIAKFQLTSLSGAAQKNYFNVLDKIVRKVLEDQYNPRLIKDLLQDLSSTLCILTSEGKSLLIGNINIWICRLETILLWQEQLSNLQMTKQVSRGLTFSDLPLCLLNNILHRFSDGQDIITLGQVTPTLYVLSENRQLWRKLCQYHFSEKQFCRHLILTEKGHIDWKLVYFALQKCYPIKEQYGDTLKFCRHCSILFWKDTGHPCTANDPNSCFVSVSPQHFIDLFKF